MDSSPQHSTIESQPGVEGALPALNGLRERRRAAEAAVKPGEFVRLQGMEQRPELNGLRGLVCGVTMLGTIKVLMDDTQEQLGVPLERVVKTGAILVRGNSNG